MIPMVGFQKEKNPMELWLPKNAEKDYGNYYHNGKWIESNFPSNDNHQLFKLMFESTNTPLTTGSNSNSIIDVLNEILTLSTTNGTTWYENTYPVCTKFWSSLINGTECRMNR